MSVVNTGLVPVNVQVADLCFSAHAWLLCKL